MTETEQAARRRERLGFRDGDRGTHSSRTMMLTEIGQLLETTESATERPVFRHLIVEENILDKRTANNRLYTFRHLSELYGLDPEMPVYRLFRRLWDQDSEGRPLLAVLCSCARDPLLRASAPAILENKEGTVVEGGALVDATARHYAKTTARSVGRNLVSTWSQSGHLQGRLTKVRARPEATPGAAAYAVALGFMEGQRGQLLMSTFWTALLDCSDDELRRLLVKASRRNWLDYRTAGDVVDIRPEKMFTPNVLELLDG